MALLGAMMSAVPSGSESCFSNPRRRLAESNAVNSVEAMTLPFRSSTSSGAEVPVRRRGSRKEANCEQVSSRRKPHRLERSRSSLVFAARGHRSLSACVAGREDHVQ